MTESLALGEDSLFLRRVYPVTPKRMWRAWTEPGQLAQWFLPSPTYRMVEAQCLPEIGGAFRVVVEENGVTGGVIGSFVEVDPLNRLVFTWRFDNTPPEVNDSLVTVEMLAVEGGTELRLTHERLTSAPPRDAFVVGWTNCLNVLSTLLERED